MNFKFEEIINVKILQRSVSALISDTNMVQKRTFVWFFLPSSAGYKNPTFMKPPDQIQRDSQRNRGSLRASLTFKEFCFSFLPWKEKSSFDSWTQRSRIHFLSYLHKSEGIRAPCQGPTTRDVSSKRVSGATSSLGGLLLERSSDSSVLVGILGAS